MRKSALTPQRRSPAPGSTQWLDGEVASLGAAVTDDDSLEHSLAGARKAELRTSHISLVFRPQGFNPQRGGECAVTGSDDLELVGIILIQE